MKKLVIVFLTFSIFSFSFLQDQDSDNTVSKLVLQSPVKAEFNDELSPVKTNSCVPGSQTLNRQFGQVVINHSHANGNSILSLIYGERLLIARQFIC